MTIAERLTEKAQQSSPEVAQELLAAAKKIDGFLRAPGSGSPRDAERMRPVLTPAVVTALGEAFVASQRTVIAIREDPGENNPAWTRYDSFRDVPAEYHALAVLLIVTKDPDLSGPALAALEEVHGLMDRMDVEQLDALHRYSHLSPGVDVVERIRAAAEARIAQEPESVPARWARELGLEVPLGSWSIDFSVPGELAEGYADVLVRVYIHNDPGAESSWEVWLGAASGNRLGRNYPPSRGITYGVYQRGDAIVGAIDPVLDPRDIPRALRDLEAAHPELTYDRGAIKGGGSPGRLLTPKRKRLLIDWLGEGE